MAEPQVNIGIELAQPGDYDGAMRALNHAIVLDSGNSSAHYNLGLALAARGDMDGARRSFETAIRLDPNNVDAHNNLGAIAGAARLARPEKRALAEGVQAMSVTIRPYVDGGWEVDIRVVLPDGATIRERRKAPTASKSAAQRWAEARERVLLVNGKPDRVKEVLRPPTTLREFARGEMIGLEWADVNLAKRQLCVARSDWRGHVAAPKGGRIRYVPLTKRLATALQAARHPRGPRVLCDAAGKPLTQKAVQVMVRRVARRANVKPGLSIGGRPTRARLSANGMRRPKRAVLRPVDSTVSTVRRERAPRASHAIGASAKRRARARVGESEGRSPSE